MVNSSYARSEETSDEVADRYAPQEEGVEIIDDPYDSVVFFEGDWTGTTTMEESGMEGVSIRLRSYIDKDSLETTHEIFYFIHYVSQLNNDWRNYDRAFALGGEELAIQPVDDELLCNGFNCGYREFYVLPLDRETLERSIEDGFSFQIRSRREKRKVVIVTSQQIETQLSAVDDWMVSQ